MRWNTWAVLLLGASMLSAQIRPVALSAVADGRLIELDATNAVMISAAQSNFVPIFGLPKQYGMIDLAANGKLDENLIFVVMRGKDILLSPIVQYTSQGQEVRRWLIPTSYPSGIALDYPNRTLYISTLGDASIYQVDLRRNGELRYLMQVPGATRLGALAVDAAGQRLYAADPFSGTVYAVSLTNRQSSPLVNGLGEPMALAIGQGANLLYVADRAKRCVWAVHLRQGQPNPIRFWSSNSLREPLGLAVDSNGTVWIGDKSSKVVFGVTANGHELNPIR
jgi:sugar lactone lactonase YvrE